MPSEALDHGTAGGVRIPGADTGAGGVSLGEAPVHGSVPEGSGAGVGAGGGMPFMPMAPGAGGAAKDEQRSDASGLVSGSVEPWADAHGEVPGDGEVASAAGTSAGGPGLGLPTGVGGGVNPADVPAPSEVRDDRDHDAVPVPAPFPLSAPQSTTRGSGPDEGTPVRPGTLPTASRVGVGGVSVPGEGSTAAAAEEAALGEAAADEGAVAREGGMTPPYGMPGGAAPRGGDERSDSSGLLLETENGWADPEVGDLPGQTQGAPAGGATLSGSGTDSAAADEFDEGRVAVVPSTEAAEDTSAWGAADPTLLWALGGRRTEDEEEEELQPKYVLSDDDGWSDEDGSVSETGAGAGIGGDEAESAQSPEEPGWGDEDGSVFAAGLGFPQSSASADDTSVEPVAGPGLATWRPDRSGAAAAEELPPPVTGYAGMLLSTAEVPDEEDEDGQDEDGPEEDGDEAKGGRGVADLLRQGADSWGAAPQRPDEIG
ncbi:hypothetical protein ACI2L1_33865 [Streptomyces sp. NPDC019531]|uniref:hypothetical protein n=1 Tax=Streptomyces sp. NPDC019531 TaxID=3365062 RepID=UPI0038503E87